jgi:hypothetical protein
VSRAKIRKLYEQDAQGIADRDLINEVAYGFYARCQSILEVTEASRGQVRCPVCRKYIPREGYDKEQVVACVDCGWAVRWRDYKRTYKRRQLHGGGAVDVFESYVERLPHAQSAQQKMMLIDEIIHRCHVSLLSGETRYLRPVAVNLIEGRMEQVIALLEGLAYGEETVRGSQERRARWKERVLSGVRHRERWFSDTGG